MGRRSIPCLAVVASILAAGCAARSSSLTAADYQARAGSVKKIGIVLVGTGVRHLHAGGGTSPDAESAAKCATCAAEAVELALAYRGYGAVGLPLDRSYLTLLAEYRQVRDELFNASPPDGRSLPVVAPLAGAPALCAKNAVDAIVIVGACDNHFPEGGRTVFWDQALFRVYFGRGVAYADLSAVDCTGRILHYSQRSGSYCNLSDEGGVHKVFGELVSGLPEAGRQ